MLNQVIYKFRPVLLMLVALMLTLFLARFLTIGWQRMLFNANSTNGDQDAYLQLELDLREHGVLTDGTRNPLYPALLATFAEREWHYFTYAKFLSLVFGLFAILSIFYVGYRLFDLPTALLSAFLLSINMEFILHSTFVLAEALLTLCILWAWFFMAQALRHLNQTRLWVIAGGLVGLAYLAKGTGQLILGSFMLAALLLHGLGLRSQRNFWLFLASYSVIALPLWIYNWQIFDNPIFNFATTHQMWMDKWEQNFVSDTASLPTMLTYLQSHSWQEAWTRQWQGMADMSFFFTKMLWPTRSLAFDHFFLSRWSKIVFALLLGTIWVYFK